MNSHVSDTVNDAKQQLTGLIILLAQDKHREPELPTPQDHQEPGDLAAINASTLNPYDSGQDTRNDRHAAYIE